MQAVVPGQHAAFIERKIRQIKERVRTHTSVLPYQLTPFLLENLVLFVAHRINCFANSTTINRISPREAFTGRKLDAKRDIMDIGFGEYVQIHNRDDPSTKNSLLPRTWGGIALYPTSTSDRAYMVWKIATNKIIRCINFTKVPLTQEIINYLNSLAEESSSPIRKEPAVVTRNGQPITAYDDETNDDTADEPATINIDDNAIHATSATKWRTRRGGPMAGYAVGFGCSRWSATSSST
jgi:hypothetical protein